MATYKTELGLHCPELHRWTIVNSRGILLTGSVISAATTTIINPAAVWLTDLSMGKRGQEAPVFEHEQRMAHDLERYEVCDTSCLVSPNATSRIIEVPASPMDKDLAQAQASLRLSDNAFEPGLRSPSANSWEDSEECFILDLAHSEEVILPRLHSAKSFRPLLSPKSLLGLACHHCFGHAMLPIKIASRRRPGTREFA